MSRFIETILVKNGRVRNITYHQLRVERTLKHFFSTRPFNLESVLLHAPKSGLFRCRLTYGKTVENIEYIPYEPVKKAKLLAIESDLNYNYKFKDRSSLDDLLKKAQHEGYDDALIVKDSLVTDTTIANIAFFNGRRWITPARPLLRGTVRARLLQSGIIIPGNITIDNLGMFSHFALMNALSGFYISGPTGNIKR